MIEACYSVIGSRIRISRVNHGWSASEMARQIGVTRAAISNIECGLQRGDHHPPAPAAELETPSGNAAGRGQEGAKEVAGPLRGIRSTCKTEGCIVVGDHAECVVPDPRPASTTAAKLACGGTTCRDHGAYETHAVNDPTCRKLQRNGERATP